MDGGAVLTEALADRFGCTSVDVFFGSGFDDHHHFILATGLRDVRNKVWRNLCHPGGGLNHDHEIA